MTGGEQDGLLQRDSDSAGAAKSASAPPPVPRRALFWATYVLYYTANTMISPLLPAIKTEMGFSSGTAATIASTCCLHSPFNLEW
jgi:hypothetical protein